MKITRKIFWDLAIFMMFFGLIVGALFIPFSLLLGIAKEEVFYTEDLPATASKQFVGLKGFPLEYTIDRRQTKVKFVAKEVKKEKLDAALFTVPEGFTEMSPEEFQKMIKGMMGG